MASRVERLRDQICILEYRAGDVGALETLISRWQVRIHRFVLILVRENEAAWDVCQDVWLAAMAGLRKGKDIEDFSAWLYGIAHNKAGHWLRRRRPESLDEDGDLPAPDPAVSDLAHVAWERERVTAALAQLPLPQRAALELTFYHGLSCAEVAEVLGCPVGTVKSRAYLARRRLAQLLADLDGDK